MNLKKSNTELTRLNEFVGKISALLNPFTYVLINIATVILIARAGLQVNLGTMHQGQVVALYNYMAQMIVELIKLASPDHYTEQKAMACADRSRCPGYQDYHALSETPALQRQILLQMKSNSTRYPSPMQVPVHQAFLISVSL